MIIFGALNIRSKYLVHLDKLNVVNNYIWWVTNVKIIIFDVLWYQIYRFFTSKHHEYSSFTEPNVWDRHLWEPNVWNIHLWRPELLNANYNYLSCREDQKWLFLTSFFTKHLKWLYLTLSNYIYIYLCHYLILWHTENPSKYNEFQIMK